MPIPSPKERMADAFEQAHSALQSNDSEQQDNAIKALGVMAWNLQQTILNALEVQEWAVGRRLVKRPPEV